MLARRKLSEAISSTLKQQKGCLLPGLGLFRVGPVVGETTRKKIRLAFTLQEGRYGAVPQERPRYVIGRRIAALSAMGASMSTRSRESVRARHFCHIVQVGGRPLCSHLTARCPWHQACTKVPHSVSWRSSFNVSVCIFFPGDLFGCV